MTDNNNNEIHDSDGQINWKLLFRVLLYCGYVLPLLSWGLIIHRMSYHLEYHFASYLNHTGGLFFFFLFPFMGFILSLLLIAFVPRRLLTWRDKKRLGVAMLLCLAAYGTLVYLIDRKLIVDYNQSRYESQSGERDRWMLENYGDTRIGANR